MSDGTNEPQLQIEALSLLALSVRCHREIQKLRLLSPLHLSHNLSKRLRLQKLL